MSCVKSLNFCSLRPHSLQGTLVDETNITPREVVKGGSLGQGTAVDGEFDLDLIIITEGTGSWLGRGALVSILALAKPLHEYTPSQTLH